MLIALFLLLLIASMGTATWIVLRGSWSRAPRRAQLKAVSKPATAAKPESEASLELPPDLPFLQKPFTATGLSEMVRQVLGGGDGATSRGDLP